MVDQTGYDGPVFSFLPALRRVCGRLRAKAHSITAQGCSLRRGRRREQLPVVLRYTRSGFERGLAVVGEKTGCADWDNQGRLPNIHRNQ
jgi:hypothetical protein